MNINDILKIKKCACWLFILVWTCRGSWIVFNGYMNNTLVQFMVMKL